MSLLPPRKAALLRVPVAPRQVWHDPGICGVAHIPLGPLLPSSLSCGSEDCHTFLLLPVLR